jgi:PAS domain S-box
MSRRRFSGASTSVLRRWRSAFDRERPLVAYLVSVPLASGLPILLFSALLIYQLQAAHEDAARLVVERQAREFQLAIERDIRNAIQMLQVLADSHALAVGDLATFYEESSEAASRAGGRILLIDPETKFQRFNTLAPYGADLPPTSAPETVDDVVATRKPQVSGVFRGRVSGQWVFDIATPVFAENGTISHVLMLSYEATHILQILSEQELSRPGRIVVIDKDGNVVTTSENHEEFAGQPLPSDWVRDTLRFGSANIWTSGNITAAANAAMGGWRVIVTTPTRDLVEPYRQTWSRLLIIGGGFLLLSVALATRVGRIITGAARSLAEAAESLGQGRTVAAKKTPISDVNRVGEALVEASRRLREGRAIEIRLATVLRASGEAVYSLSSKEIIETWNPAAERLFGYTAEEIIGKPIDVLVPEENRAERVEAFLRATGGESITFETSRRRKDGSCFAAAITAAPLPGRRGGFVSVARDISQRKAAEERVRLLLHELSHRTKNLLAVVQSIASQTARSSPSVEAFQERFGARILAMSATHDALVSQNWSGASIHQVVTGQLAAILSDSPGQTAIEGPDFLLKAGVAESLGMALHELAVNAIKYGAFVCESGCVKITWSIDGSSAAPRLKMSWIEEGGPEVQEPTTRGFGYAVMKDVLERRTRGRVDIRFASAGLQWTFEAPLENLKVSPQSGNSSALNTDSIEEGISGDMSIASTPS